MIDLIRLRRYVVDRLIRQAGSLPTKALERLRDSANYALGAGAASLGMDESGEAKLLKHLAELWADRVQITVVDVGAYHGGYALAVRSAFGERADVHCFEPNPVNLDTLRQRLGAQARTHCYRLALGAEPRTARLFTNRRDSPLASLHAETFSFADIPVADSQEVEVDTLDRVAERLDLRFVDLLKVDVEGHELEVLRGAREILERGGLGLVQFEFGERSLASRTYLRDFLDLFGDDYELFRLSPRGLARVDYRPACEVFLLETNYVAVPASWRLGRAVSFA